jgi:hypothetical protein
MLLEDLDSYPPVPSIDTAWQMKEAAEAILAECDPGVPKSKFNGVVFTALDGTVLSIALTPMEEFIITDAFILRGRNCTGESSVNSLGGTTCSNASPRGSP